MKKILPCLILFLICLNASANERLYKIELLIFSQNRPDSEVFDQTISKIAWPKSVVERSTYTKVAPENMTLRASYFQTRRNSSYAPLMHVAWIQSARSNSYSRAVKINNTDGTINGFFRLQRGHLVHMIADIEYTPDNSLYDQSVIYQLNEKRRFKLKETHYLDHPKFGILARISPVQK